MDRSYKAPERVHIYASVASCDKGEDPLSIVHLVAYSHQGLDNYQYLGRMYAGYVDARTHGEVRIFLDRPLS